MNLPGVTGVSNTGSQGTAPVSMPSPKPQKTVNDWVRDKLLSADVNKTTVGVESARITPELMLATSKKLLKLNRREAEPDAKDSLEFQRVYGPSDYFAEHVLRDANRIGRQLLWKATNKGNVDFMPVGALDQHVSDVFNSSKAANMIDGSSPLETVEASMKVSRIGEGGIGSIDSAPTEMRLVQPSFLGYIDPVRSVESLRVGLDAYLSKHCKRGTDGKLYQKFINARTGKEELVDSVTAAKSVITTPDMMKAKTNHIYAVGGKTGVRIVKKSDVDYYLPRMDDAFTTASNMVTGLSGVKELRLLMGCLHPLTGVITYDKKNMASMSEVKSVNSNSGRIAGLGQEGSSSVHQIRTTVSKFPLSRAWFKKVVLYSGRALVTSRDHRWPVLRGDKLVLVPAEKLKEGDKVLRSTFKDVPNRRTFINGVLVTRNIATFLGYAVRSLSNPDEDKLTIQYQPQHRDAITAALEKLGIKKDFKFYQTSYRHTMAIRSGWFYDWLKEHIGVKDQERRIPSEILSAYMDVVAAFIDGYTADDTQVGMDSLQYVWILNIPNTMVRDGLSYLLVRMKTDTLYRDSYEGGGKAQLALKLVELKEGYGDCVVDEVKDVQPVPNASIMVDIDINDNMYAVANGIITHNSKYPQQAVSIEGREPPLVRNLDGQSGKDLHSIIGKYLGARYASKPGTVTAVRKDRIDMLYDDGTRGSVALYRNFPMNAKGYLDNTPQVKAGMHVDKGGLLASSNYTDDKGVAATGTNLRVGWMSWKGGTYEDAIVLSESAAKKLTSTTMYSQDLDLDKTITLGKKNYMLWKPGEYTKEQLSVLDDDGIVKPGMVLQKGDPMVLAIQTAEPSPGTMGKRILTDISETWEHDHPGVVTDVLRTKKGVKVIATVTAPVEVGDKISGLYGNKGIVSQVIPDTSMPVDKYGKPLEMLLSPLGLISRCYDDQTEFLTRSGWKLGKDVKDEDELYCFNKDTFTWEWGKQIAPFWRNSYEGHMYAYSNKVVDFCVTPGHRVWCCNDYPGSSYSERHIEDIYGKRYYLPCVGKRRQLQPEATPFRLPCIEIRHKDTHTTKEDRSYDPYDWAEFLGWYLSEGNTTVDERTSEYRVNIAQYNTVNMPNVFSIAALLDRLHLKWNYGKKNKQFHISDKRLAIYLSQFGHSWEKYIPQWLFRQPDAVLRCFIDAIMRGDGCITNTGRYTKDEREVLSKHITLASKKLIDQLQILLCMLGIPSTVSVVAHDKRYTDSHTLYRLGMSTVQKCERLLRSGWEIRDYKGMTYCPTVNTGYILTRRNGKVICMGNTNPNQLTEALLGKVAKKTGQYETIPAFYDGNIRDLVDAKLKRAHLNAEDDFFDPETGRKIPGITNGYAYIHKLKHLAESKLSARGTGEYSSDDTPAGSGMSGSKRYGGLELGAMVGHEAFDNLLDLKLIRGQSNADFWRSIRTGGIPTIPGEPLVQRKFFAHLQGAGVNVRKTPKGISVFPLSNSDVKEMAGPRELKSRDTYEAKNFRPIDGGLFGQDVFGVNGDRWGYIQLDEPVPNPVMAEPLARLLRISDKDFVKLASGAGEVNGMSGGQALKDKLATYDLEKEAKQAQQEFKEAPASKKDAALKRYVAIENMRRQGLNPAEYMLDRIPVLPPTFRPVTSHKGLTMVADANYLYAQLLDARDDLRDAKDLPKEYQDKARQSIYRSWQELNGLYDPEDVKLRNKNVGGLLQWALGKGSPKFSGFQRKVLGSAVDTVGRGVIMPDSKITVDEIGIPVKMAFGIMAPFVERALVKRGYTPIDAMKMVKNQSPQAFDVLKEVVETHPVQMNRAPTLHKYNIMAFKPKLVQGNAIHINPSVCPSFAADFDGNCVDFDSEIIIKISKSSLDKTSFMQYIISVVEKDSETITQNNGDDNMRIGANELVTVFNPAEEKDSLYFQMKIGEFPRAGEPVKDNNGADVYNVPEGVKVLGCDRTTGKPGWYEVTALTHEKDCHTVKVTAGGRSVIVSDNESLAVFDNATGELLKVRPSVDEKRFIPILKKDPRDYGPFGDRDLGWLFGAFISDGWITPRTVGYCKLEKTKRDLFVQIMRKYHDNFTVYEYAEDGKGSKEKLGNSVKLHLNSTTLVDWWKQWGLYIPETGATEGRSALRKCINPAMIQYGSEEFLYGLLSGLIDGDGSLVKNTSTKNPRFGCRFSTSSERLKDDICKLLYRLGMRCSVTVTPPRNFSNTAYTVCPSTVDMWSALPKLTCIGERERTMIADWVNAVPAKDDTDLVPVSDKEFKQLSEIMSSTGRFASLYTALHRKGVRKASRGVLMKYANDIRIMAPTLYDRMMETDTLWAQIESVEDAGNREVFDLMVPDGKVYAVNNGFVVWDTVNIHVPVSDNARKEAMDRMRPSRNLIALSNHKIMYKPEKEYMQGLYIATRMGASPDGRARIFRTLDDAREARRRGEIDVDTPIQILENNK